ncbi:hypothetical protein HPB49_020806 [Dermacentor silvarum]|uniref:Uncharacterized protein n=1 Tax=Dermacentor silvarum TaxID=543639 RepID=A0ACB8DG25_DERSI|nr:hypothetical protein HPB49_020806 [Dermacentor silvarum]
MVFCSVVGCSNRSGSSRRKKKPTNTNFFRIPRIVVDRCERSKMLSTNRRTLWLARINRADLDPQNLNLRVCGAHFVTDDIDTVIVLPERAENTNEEEGDDDNTNAFQRRLRLVKIFLSMLLVRTSPAQHHTRRPPKPSPSFEVLVIADINSPIYAAWVPVSYELVADGNALFTP